MLACKAVLCVELPSSGFKVVCASDVLPIKDAEHVMQRWLMEFGSEEDCVNDVTSTLDIACVLTVELRMASCDTSGILNSESASAHPVAA